MDPLGRRRRPWAVARGAELFGSGCVTCHGTGGVGGAGPSLRPGNPRNGDPDWAAFRVIRDGVPGTAMPPHELPDAGTPSRAVPAVTPQRLLAAATEPRNWPTYSGTYNASPITYAVEGRQYFALAAGRSIVAVALP